MNVRSASILAIALSGLLGLSAAAIGWAQPTTPPGQEQQPAPGTMGSGMMRGPMMPMMGDMQQMMQMCVQMMSQMKGATTPQAPSAPGK